MVGAGAPPVPPFSTALYCLIGQWTYAKGWGGNGDLVTCMYVDVHKIFVWI